MNKKGAFILSFIFLGVFVNSTCQRSNPNDHYSDVIEMLSARDSSWYSFVQDQNLYEENWHQLAQPVFWRTVMRMPNDSGVINIAASRQIIETFSVNTWDTQSKETKQAYRDSIKNYYCLKENAKVYFTTGKNHFYDFNKAIPGIHKAIDVFSHENVDPWYAQAILLIESPNQLQKSPVGAYGSFQLMKSVARQMGLKVNKYVDERKDFNKSAMGAAKLIRTSCVPETKKILDNKCIAYQESDIWFRLLVLHVYHAGAYNVGKVIDFINPDEGNQDLIKTIWQTKYGRFGNASQNYSQVALASLMELDQLIQHTCEIVQPCLSLE